MLCNILNFIRTTKTVTSDCGLERRQSFLKKDTAYLEVILGKLLLNILPLRSISDELFKGGRRSVEDAMREFQALTAIVAVGFPGKLQEQESQSSEVHAD